MQVKMKDVVVVGFALFAIFFGAGNLIFPPYLGVTSGDQWFTAMLGFLLSDPVLPILGVIVTASLGGRPQDFGKRVGTTYAAVLGFCVVLAIGPMFAIPRTASTTYEVFVREVFPAVPVWVSALVFFGITLWLTLNPGKVVDIIGQFLTPGLLLILLALIGVSIVNPPGEILSTGMENVFAVSLKEGYQTMDAIVASLFAGIVIADLKRKGYVDKKHRMKATIYVGVLAFILLAVIYGGLTYAGATVSSFYDADTERTTLLVGMVTHLLGGAGKIAIGLAIALACLTTSIGLTSVCGDYFSGLSKGKLSYKLVALVTTVVSFAISLLGVDTLIGLAVPVLSAIYPMVICLIFMQLFDKKIKYNMTYIGAVVGAFFIGLVQALNSGFGLFQGLADWTYTLPFNGIGFEWVVPAIIGGVVFTIIAMVGKVGKTIDDYPEEDDDVVVEV